MAYILSLAQDEVLFLRSRWKRLLRVSFAHPYPLVLRASSPSRDDCFLFSSDPTIDYRIVQSDDLFLVLHATSRRLVKRPSFSWRLRPKSPPSTMAAPFSHKVPPSKLSFEDRGLLLSWTATAHALLHAQLFVSEVISFFLLLSLYFLSDSPVEVLSWPLVSLYKLDPASLALHRSAPRSSQTPFFLPLCP